MFCQNCGKELGEDAKFCPYCGASTHGAEETPVVAPATGAAPVQPQEDKPPKVWSIFALVGKILGIVCLCASVIPYLNYFSFVGAIIGIVLSCLGRKAKNEVSDKNSGIGLKLSIAALVISFVLMIVYTVVFTVFLGGIIENDFYNTYY